MGKMNELLKHLLNQTACLRSLFNEFPVVLVCVVAPGSKHGDIIKILETNFFFKADK